MKETLNVEDVILNKEFKDKQGCNGSVCQSDPVYQQYASLGRVDEEDLQTRMYGMSLGDDTLEDMSEVERDYQGY